MTTTIYEVCIIANGQRMAPAGLDPAGLRFRSLADAEWARTQIASDRDVSESEFSIVEIEDEGDA